MLCCAPAWAQESAGDVDEVELRRYTVEVIIFRYAEDVGAGAFMAMAALDFADDLVMGEVDIAPACLDGGAEDKVVGAGVVGNQRRAADGSARSARCSAQALSATRSILALWRTSTGRSFESTR